jgi:hypothetical protein
MEWPASAGHLHFARMHFAASGAIFARMAKASAKPVTIFDAPMINAKKAWAEGEADIEAGRTVPHAKVKRWLKSWGTAKELPAPRWRKRK